jgi:hypothetical protein
MKSSRRSEPRDGCGRRTQETHMMFLLECIDLADFPVAAKSTIRHTKTGDMEPSHKALNELMLDCFKKVRESKNKRKRAAAQETIAAGRASMPDVADPEDPAPKRLRLETARPVVMYIMDPTVQLCRIIPRYDIGICRVRRNLRYRRNRYSAFTLLIEHSVTQLLDFNWIQ